MGNPVQVVFIVGLFLTGPSARAMESVASTEAVAVAAGGSEAASSGVFQARGCSYRVFTVPDGGRPPRYHLIIVRVPAPDPECTSASRFIASSYTGAFQVAVKGSQGIAISFQSKLTPSGSGLQHVRLFHISPKTLEIVREEFLGTPFGSTYVSALYFQGSSLIAETNRYTATFPHFLTSTLPPEGVEFP